MKKPYTICHILSSLNGKISGPFMGTESVKAVSREYARIRSEMKGDAWLYGTTTTKEFTGFQKPQIAPYTRLVPDGDFVAEDRAELYYVSVDGAGEIGWKSGTFSMAGRPDAHVIEVLTEAASMEYRAYLRERNISYIIAGDQTMDCGLVKEKLLQLFGIEKLIICGGGGIDWSFMGAGEIDELSLVMAPAADGEPGFPSVFEQVPGITGKKTAKFSLKDITRLPGDGIHLVFEAKED